MHVAILIHDAEAEGMVALGEKLAHILANGQHDYLKDLIDTLYRLVLNDGFKEPEPGASYWSSGDGNE